jgi:hypothetical protein
VGVIRMLVFPVCWDDENDGAGVLKHVGVLQIYKILLIYMLCICWSRPAFLKLWSADHK